jgi:hypothetical protein
MSRVVLSIMCPSLESAGVHHRIELAYCRAFRKALTDGEDALLTAGDAMSPAQQVRILQRRSGGVSIPLNGVDAGQVAESRGGTDGWAGEATAQDRLSLGAAPKTAQGGSRPGGDPPGRTIDGLRLQRGGVELQERTVGIALGSALPRQAVPGGCAEVRLLLACPSGVEGSDDEGQRAWARGIDGERGSSLRRGTLQPDPCKEGAFADRSGVVLRHHEIAGPVLSAPPRRPGCRQGVHGCCPVKGLALVGGRGSDESSLDDAEMGAGSAGSI